MNKRYLALLRGINVGGSNIIRMSALKESFQGLGFENVSTYIQSGNVLFETAEEDIEELTQRIEEALSKDFNYRSRVVVVSHEQLRLAVEDAPEGFGLYPAEYRYDVIFLKSPLAAEETIEHITTKEGVDQAFAGEGVLYFSRLIAKATQSRLSRVVQLPIYQSMTIRNWNTVTKLLALMEAS